MLLTFSDYRRQTFDNVDSLKNIKVLPEIRKISEETNKIRRSDIKPGYERG